MRSSNPTAASARPARLTAAIDALVAGGAANVVVTRAHRPTLASINGRRVRVSPPTLEAVEPKGGGDSYTAAMAAAVAHGRTMVDALDTGRRRRRRST